MTEDERQERIDDMMHGIRTDLEKAKTIDIKREYGLKTSVGVGGFHVIEHNGVIIITITANNSVKLKVRRPRIRRFLWHVKDGFFRSEGYSWWKIWKMTKGAPHG